MAPNCVNKVQIPTQLRSVIGFGNFFFFGLNHRDAFINGFRIEGGKGEAVPLLSAGIFN